MTQDTPPVPAQEAEMRHQALLAAVETVARCGSPPNHTVFIAADYLAFLRTGQKPLVPAKVGK
ncbi:hypothetical protein [Roseomonas sp. USHLN139]|uniref:hypothetical protein n=1 Tax=Roseomonas sp. USHLN139 TaxID=3081298 RepID=UPI003B02DA35